MKDRKFLTIEIENHLKEALKNLIVKYSDAGLKINMSDIVRSALVDYLHKQYADEGKGIVVGSTLKKLSEV